MSLNYIYRDKLPRQIAQHNTNSKVRIYNIIGRRSSSRVWLTIYVWVPTKAIHPHAQNQGSMRLLFTISDNRCYIFRTQTHSNRIPSSFTLCTKGEKWYLIQSFKV
jgi:hypothetical protein